MEDTTETQPPTALTDENFPQVSNIPTPTAFEKVKSRRRVFGRHSTDDAKDSSVMEGQLLETKFEETTLLETGIGELSDHEEDMNNISESGILEPQGLETEELKNSNSEDEDEDEDGLDNMSLSAQDDSSFQGENSDETSEQSSKTEASKESSEHAKDEAPKDDRSSESPESNLDEPQEKASSEDSDDAVEKSTEKTSPENLQKESPAATVEEEPQKHEGSSEPAEKSTEGPSVEDLLTSAEVLFEQAGLSVTLKEIYVSLRAEYGIAKLSLEHKGAVRQRLTELVASRRGESNHKENEQEESSVGDAESSDDEASDFDPDEESDQPITRSSRKSKQAGARLRTKTPNKKVVAIRKHAEKLRKKRMEELRVRNEELMEEATSQQEQALSEEIKHKFDTNTDDHKIQRLEQRLDLLQKLDKTRLQVLQKETVVKEQESAGNEAEPTEVELSDSDSDDDEMELELTGQSTKLWKNTPPKLPPKDDALVMLDLADNCCLAAAKKPKSKTFMSPGRARAALRNKLTNHRRQVGNNWLARELGYETAYQHVQDCLTVEARKRQAVLQREQARLAANERKTLREKLLLEEANAGYSDESDGDEAYVPEETAGEEPDEEQEMARQIEAEQPDEEQEGAEPVAAGTPKDDMASNVSVVESKETDGDVSKEVGSADSPMESTENESTLLPEDSVVESGQSDLPVDTSTCDDSPEPQSSVERKVDFEESEVLGEDSQEFETQPPDASHKAVNSTDAEAAGENGEETADDAADTPDELLLDSTEEPKQDAHDESETTESSEVNEEEEGDREPERPKGPRNSAWQEMLRREKEQMKKQKKSGLVEEEADEEEEEEIVGLENFGFGVGKKNNDDNEDLDSEVDEDDLKHVVDDVSDNEGDEDAGEEARLKMQQNEEKEQHKEMMRRMREGYDGRRGGIAGGGFGARGMHRFDQLVAADNREDAKRLGLLNDDELDSDNEEGKTEGDEEEDENVLLDKILKDRFLHRSSVELEENFSDDEVEEQEEASPSNEGEDKALAEKREQEKLAKRFSKRARMQRLIDTYGHEEEFSQSRLIEEDASLQMELQQMKNGLSRKRSQSSQLMGSNPSSKSSQEPAQKKTKSSGNMFLSGGGSLAIALQKNRKSSSRTNFARRGSSNNTSETMSSFKKAIGFNHFVFDSQSSSNSRSNIGQGGLPAGGRKRKTQAIPSGSSLWSKAVLTGFEKRT